MTDMCGRSAGPTVSPSTELDDEKTLGPSSVIDEVSQPSSATIVDQAASPVARTSLADISPTQQHVTRNPVPAPPLPQASPLVPLPTPTVPASTSVRTPAALRIFAAQAGPRTLNASLVVSSTDQLLLVLASLLACAASAMDVTIRTEFILERNAKHDAQRSIMLLLQSHVPLLHSFAWEVRGSNLYPISPSAPQLEHARAEIAQLRESARVAASTYLTLTSLDVLTPASTDVTAAGAHRAEVLAQVAPNLQTLRLRRALEDLKVIDIHSSLTGLLLDQHLCNVDDWRMRPLLMTLQNVRAEAIATVGVISPIKKFIPRVAKDFFAGGTDIQHLVIFEYEGALRLVFERVQGQLSRRWVFDQVTVALFYQFLASPAFQAIRRITVSVEMRTAHRRALYSINPTMLEDLTFVFTSDQRIPEPKNLLSRQLGVWCLHKLKRVTFSRTIPDLSALAFLAPLYVPSVPLPLVPVSHVMDFMVGSKSNLTTLEMLMDIVDFEEGWAVAETSIAPKIQRLSRSSSVIPLSS